MARFGTNKVTITVVVTFAGKEIRFPLLALFVHKIRSLYSSSHHHCGCQIWMVPCSHGYHIRKHAVAAGREEGMERWEMEMETEEAKWQVETE